MKYIGFWDFDLKDMDVVIEKFSQRQLEPEKYPKILFGPFTMGDEFKGFTGLEAFEPEQLLNLQFHFAPEIKWKFTPMFDTNTIIPLWQQRKK